MDINDLKSLIHPNILQLIEDQITPQVMPGYTQTSTDGYYGTVVYRVVAVISLRDCTGFPEKWHPSNWAGAYKVRELVAVTCGGSFATHLVVSVPLLEDNTQWTYKNTDYEKSCAQSKCKPQKVLPIGVTAKQLLKWYKIMGSHIIAKYLPDNLTQTVLYAHIEQEEQHREQDQC